MSVHNFSGRVLTHRAIQLCIKAHSKACTEYLITGSTKPIPLSVDSMIGGKPAGKIEVTVNTSGCIYPK